MARPKSDRIPAHFRIKKAVLTHFNLLTLNPLSGQPQHGLRSEILETLLQRLFNSLRQEEGSDTIYVGDLQRKIKSRF